MSIIPLPVFEADVDPTHRDAMNDLEIYERLESPKTIVVRFGARSMIGEYAYDGDAKPGCGSKLVARTHRGTEVAEMLTTTCPNSGCAKAVTRQEMMDYIENSGGKEFPFQTRGKILRVATIDDLNGQSNLDSVRRQAVVSAKSLINELRLPMKLVDAEPILGGETLTVYYMADERIDFREMVNRMAGEFKTRIEMRQVGARDEARLVADYERCGQHCCCKNFLKVLRPISMRHAKNQGRPLEALKISGRCGRLMCCLRYEDQTYKELRKNLPKRKTRVGTAEGPGIVQDTKVLVQLVLVQLEFDQREIAVPAEELMDPDQCPNPEELAAIEAEKLKAEAFQVPSPTETKERTGERKNRRRRRGRKSRDENVEAIGDRTVPETGDQTPDKTPDKAGEQEKPQEAGERSKRRRRRRRGRDGSDAGGGSGAAQSGGTGGSGGSDGEQASGSGEGGKSKRRRRRRGGRGRRPGPDGGGGGSSGGANPSG